jgi:hypothetical protein
MTERAKLQRAMMKASLIATPCFMAAAVLPMVIPQKYETAYLTAMAVLIAVGTWWTVKLQELRKRLQATPPV